MTRSFVVLGALLAACGTSSIEAENTDGLNGLDPFTGAAPVSFDELELEQSAPPGPGGLTLDLEGDLEPGSTATWTVTGAAPGGLVVLLYGPSDLGPQAGACPPQLAAAGICLDIAPPTVLNTTTANAAGEAVVSLTVPPTPDGFTLAFQAVAPAGALSATSNTVTRYNANRFDSGMETGLNGLLIAVNNGLGNVVPPANYSGIELLTFFDGTYWGTTFRDICTIAYDVQAPAASGAAPAPCPTCTFDFTADFTALDDVSQFGDCSSYLGIDVSTITPFEWSYGYDPSYVTPAGVPQPTFQIYDAASASWVLSDYGFGTGIANFDAATGAYDYLTITNLFLFY